MPHAHPLLAPLATLVLAAGLSSPAFAQSSSPVAPSTERLAASPGIAAATGAPCNRERLSNLHRRLMAEADRGQEEMLRYVHRTRMIHQLDPHEAGRWVEAMRSGQGNCAAVVAAAP